MPRTENATPAAASATPRLDSIRAWLATLPSRTVIDNLTTDNFAIEKVAIDNVDDDEHEQAPTPALPRIKLPPPDWAKRREPDRTQHEE